MEEKEKHLSIYVQIVPLKREAALFFAVPSL